MDPRPGRPLLSTGCFWACLWLGRVDRKAPFYFVALTALLVALASSPGGGQETDALDHIPAFEEEPPAPVGRGDLVRDSHG